MKRLLASAIQFDMQLGNMTANIEKVEKMLAVAGGRKSNFVLLPEMFSAGFLYSHMKEIAKTSFEVIRLLQEKALQYRYYIIAGSLPIMQPSTGKIYNRSYLISPDGAIIGEYDKNHIFFGNKEDQHFAQGTKSPLFNTSFVNIGIQICFDIRFPETIRQLTKQGMKILFVPAQFPNPRKDHWLTLLKARAIENQIYVVAANVIGKDDQQDYFGNSLIIAPNGEVLANAGGEQTVISEYLDLAEQEQYRKDFPVL